MREVPAPHSRIANNLKVIQLGARDLDRNKEPKRKHEAEDGRPPSFTDEALALRFAEIYAGKLRYVAAWGRWLSFDGMCWRLDDTLFAFDQARKICRAAAAKCKNTKIAKVLASAKTVAAIVTLAKADRRL